MVWRSGSPRPLTPLFCMGSGFWSQVSIGDETSAALWLWRALICCPIIALVNFPPLGASGNTHTHTHTDTLTHSQSCIHALDSPLLDSQYFLALALFAHAFSRCVSSKDLNLWVSHDLIRFRFLGHDSIQNQFLIQMILDSHVHIPSRLKPLKVIELPLSAPCDPPTLPSSTPDLSDVGGRRQVKGSQDRQGMNGALSANSEDTCTEEVSIFNKH